MTDDYEEIETVDVPKQAFIYMAYEIAMNGDDHEVMLPDDATVDEFYDNMGPNDVDSVEVLNEDVVLIHAETKVREVIDKIPATRWQPAEYKTREIDVIYSIELELEGFNGHLHAEGV